MIPCLTAFDNLESCLAHLSTCPWLSNAWYWCPFCTRPEQFAKPEPSLTTPTKHEPSSEGNKHAPFPDQKHSYTKSGATRFFKTIGSKLGLKLQTPFTRLGPDTDSANRDLKSSTPPSLLSVRTTDTVSELPVTDLPQEVGNGCKIELPEDAKLFESSHPSHTVGMDRRILSSNGYRVESLQSPDAPSYETVPRRTSMSSVVELDIDSMLPAELSGDPFRDLGFSEAAELPNDGYEDCQPLVSTGSNPLVMDVSNHWSAPIPLLSHYNTYSDISWHSRDFLAPMESLPVYTQDPQHIGFSTGNSQETLQADTFRNNTNEISLPLYVGPSNIAVIDTFRPRRRRAFLEPQLLQTHDPFPAATYSNAGEYQPSSTVDEIQPIYAPVSMSQDRPSQQGSSFSQVHSTWSRMGAPGRVKRSSRLSEGSIPNHSLSFSPQGTSVDISGDDQMLHDGAEQHHRPSSPPPTHAHGTYGAWEHAVFEKPLPCLPTSTHKEDAAFTSPTDSTISTHRDSDRVSSSGSNATPPTSAETSPTSPGIPPTFHPQRINIPNSSQCPRCNTVFTGSFQNRRSNLKRHAKYKHDQQEKFKCPTEGCKKECSRPDNLLKHRRVEHQHVQGLKRSNAHKVRRDF